MIDIMALFFLLGGPQNVDNPKNVFFIHRIIQLCILV